VNFELIGVEYYLMTILFSLSHLLGCTMDGSGKLW